MKPSSSVERLAVLLAAGGLLLVLPAVAQEREPPRPALEEKIELDERYEVLRKEAAKLVAGYQAVLEKRIGELSRADPTLKRLREAGIFTKDALIAGLPEDPLEALPYLKERVLDTLDQRALEFSMEFSGSTREHNERVAISLLKKIVRSQKTYREEDRDGNGILDYASDLKELARTRLMERDATNGFAAHGYQFYITHGDVLTFTAEAIPQRAGETGERFFFVDETGVIRAERLRSASRGSPPLEGGN